MARQYSLKKFLRQAPNTLLERYLIERQVAADVPWQQLTKTGIDPVYRAIEAADEDVRRQIECDFVEIYAMADEGGVRTIIEEGRDPHHNLELANKLGEMESHLDCAFWTFLEHPPVFEVARRLHHADSQTRWRKRDDLPDTEPGTDPEARNELAAAISDYYRKKEGRGHACQVDHYRREDRLYWFAYPEDYAVGQLVYDDQHQLQLQTQRPAFEVIFVYNLSERSLDMWLRGDKYVLGDLQRIFGTVILGVDLNFEDRTGVVYDLQGLVSRNFPFPLEPSDGVEAVRVRRLRLRVAGSSNKRITLEANTSENPKAVYDLLDDVLASEMISADRLLVTSAELQLLFRPDADGKRGRSLAFTVSHPNSCSLKYEPRHEVAKMLLKRWEIDVSGRTEDGITEPRRSVQRTLRL